MYYIIVAYTHTCSVFFLINTYKDFVKKVFGSRGDKDGGWILRDREMSRLGV